MLNAFGDAACALTPLRIGGEPARLAGMLRSRVPAPAAFVAISLEVLAAWPVIIVAAGWLAWRYAPDWWLMAGPAARRGGDDAPGPGCWPSRWLSVLAWRAARKVASPAARQLRRPVRRAMVYWRRMPRWPLVASMPMSLINLATRVAILPVLALTLPEPAGDGAAGAGLVRAALQPARAAHAVGRRRGGAGFLGGAAGDLGTGEGWLLLAWRFYTNGIGVMLGVALAARIYGWPALRRLAGRWSDPH